MPDGKTE